MAYNREEETELPQDGSLNLGIGKQVVSKELANKHNLNQSLRYDTTGGNGQSGEEWREVPGI